MALRRLSEAQIEGRKVFVRCDLNVPLNDGKVADDTRITSSLETLRWLLDRGNSLIVASHLGRPKGKVVPELQIRPVGERLSELLDHPIRYALDCTGEEAIVMSRTLNSGEVVLLENLRFYPGETAGDRDFAAHLASLAEIYVNDAFGTCHRAHASVSGIPEFIPGYAGFLIEKEVSALDSLLNGKGSFTAVLGGAKVSDKIGLVRNLLDRVDRILIGGGMAFTFLKAMGFEIGLSLLEEDYIEEAGKVLELAKEKDRELLLPGDAAAAISTDEPSGMQTCHMDVFPSDRVGVDIGPNTAAVYSREIRESERIFWNGPMGIFEVPEFAAGTNAVAYAVAQTEGYTVIGGGDSVSAVNKLDIADKIDHISTGGGASLEYVEGRVLPGIAALSE
jgi:phosphoglycerate kinase